MNLMQDIATSMDTIILRRNNKMGMKRKDGKKVCNFLIGQELDSKLREYCERTDKVKGKVIERAIEEYLMKN